jgi:3-oxoacyl-[acyl-carrier protein] reductase
LAAEYSLQAVQLDLRETASVARLATDLEREGALPNVIIHCAATSRYASLEQISEEDWHAVQTVNGFSAFLTCQQFGPKLAAQGGGDIVLVGALDRTQSLPLPVHFAASQGLLSAMTMALAKELGPRNIRVNMVASGPLDAGLSREIAPQLLEDYKSFSSLRRMGSPEEVARAIVWLALENTYMSGKVLPVNGGI